MLIKLCLSGYVRITRNGTPAYCWYIWKTGLQEYVICSHIRKYCGFLQHWIIWTCIVSYKAVERGCVVRVTYLHNYLLDYLLTYSIEQSPLEKPTGSQLFSPHFFLSIWRMQNILSVADLFDSFHSSGNSYLLQLLLISRQISERIVLPLVLINSVSVVLHQKIVMLHTFFILKYSCFLMYISLLI
jgi:hypothetical protein